MSKTFLVGDRITWKSQAGGSWKQKTGTVVEVVPAFKFPKGRGFGSSRKVESYIVEVTYPAKQSRSPIKAVRTKKPERYWPVVGNLRLVKGGSGLGTVVSKETGLPPVPRPLHVESDPTPASKDPEGDYAEAEEKRATAGLEKFCDPDALGADEQNDLGGQHA